MTARAGVSVGVLLDSLGADVLSPMALPFGREPLVSAAVVYDPEEPPATADGTLLLVTGRPTPELLERAAEAAVVAMVVRAGRPNSAALVDAAHRTGTTLLAAAGEVAWGRIYMLIDAVLAVAAPAYNPDAPAVADLFALANEVALSVGGAVTIEDLAMRVLSYSTIEGQAIDDVRRAGILGRRVPDLPSNLSEYAAVLRSDTAVWIHDEPAYPRLALAVRSHGEALGSIWVLQADTPLAEDTPKVLAEAARRAAPHLARISVAADAVRRRRDERLGWLVSGVGSAIDVAESAGLPAEGPLTVLAIGPRDRSADEFSARHGSDLLRVSYAAYRLRAAVGDFHGRAHAVVACAADSPLLIDVTTDMLRQLGERLGGTWRAGVGRTVDAAGDIPQSAREADEALRVLLGPFADEPVGLYESLTAARFLQDVDAALRVRPAASTEPLSKLLDHDARRGTQYVRNLRCLVATQFDVPRAAEILSLHPNTLRYRLRRISELVNLDDPDTRLVLALQLRLHGPDD